ncbi:MAG: bifunctional oligoribonuclease/PAP phosphatase NrnA [Deltaproteobacteria bacterium]|nr:bifunctional oligoribonuclease/PAP phosphatase NrnA [Deltaproteobacteria bacterium]
MISAIAQELREHSRFLLATHVNPDGDAIGSLGALALVLEGMGKTVLAYCQDQVPGFLEFMPFADRIVHEIPTGENFDAAVVLDCGEVNRLGKGAEAVLQAGKIIHIDHHSSGNGFGDLNLIRPECSSTAELLYEIFGALAVELSKPVAVNIYTAILTDTGSFRFANTTARALSIAAEMVSLGVEPEEVASAVYDSMTPGRLRLLATSLQTLTLRADGRVAAIWVSREMLADTGTTAQDTEGLVNYPRSLRTVEIAVLFKELTTGEINVSLRSRGKCNVADFAQMYAGGGHENAAAFRLKGTLEQVVDEVLQAAEEYLQGKLP